MADYTLKKENGEFMAIEAKTRKDAEKRAKELNAIITHPVDIKAEKKKE